MFLSVASFLITAALAKTSPVLRNDCPAVILREDQLTPQQIDLYLQRNASKIKTVDDFVCCLPESYRRNYISATNSKAAQNSNPFNPRVLIFNPIPPATFDLRVVFSINGGDPKLNQFESVETLFVDQKKKTGAFYDIDFSPKKGVMSAANPDQCMMCHGAPSSGEGTVRFIFDPFGAWMRFANGFTPCNEAEARWLTAVDHIADESLRKNPRYRCLIPTTPAIKRELLEKFDTSLATLETTRVFKFFFF